MFLTLTFHPDIYQDNPRYVMDYVQRFFKRMRKQGVDIRYFMSIERGGKLERLHAHLIIWSKKLAEMSWYSGLELIKKNWHHKSRIDYQQVRTPGAFSYTAKYLVKELSETMDFTTGELRKTRNYTWSSKPMLGSAGVNRWKELVKAENQYKNISRQNLPGNWFNMFIMGKLVKAYIPRQYYVDTMKQYGIDLSPENFMQRPDTNIDELLVPCHDVQEGVAVDKNLIYRLESQGI